MRLAGLKFISDVGLRLVSTIVLTRLLAPEVYGVFAVVLMYLYLLEMFSDIGLRSLILTKEGDVDDSFLRTCWTVSILRGLFIALISIGLAVIIGVLQGMEVFSPQNSYSAEALPWAIASLGAATFFLGFQSPMPFMREREMDFNRVTAVHIVANIFGIVATITLAYFLRSIWALVLGYSVKYAARVVLSFVVFPGPAMRLRLDRADLKLVIERGKWIVCHSGLRALSQSGDRLFLGFAMNSATFGFYFIARQLIDMVLMFLNSVHGQMGLQVFRHLQNSTTEVFRKKYYRYRLFYDAVAGLSAGGLVVLAPWLVEIVFDDRYRGVAPIVQVLAWSILLIGPTLLQAAFSAERRFKRMTFLSLVTTSVLWIGLVVATLVFDSVSIALMVIALHRLPEAMIITTMGGDRGWVIVWREFISFVFCGVGMVLGIGFLALWNALP